MRFMKSLAAAAFALTLSHSPGGNAAVVTYADQPTWATAVGAFATESFDAGGLQSFTGVVTSVGVIQPATQLLTGSIWHDRPTVGGGESTTFSYLPGNLIGAGATWDTSPGDEGQALILTLNLVGGGTEVVGQIGPLANTFFGFVSSNPFTSFTITAGTNPGVAETFEMDNLLLAAAVVPEPATIGLLCSGLIGLAAARRRKARAAVSRTGG